jgi:hypothetical protein
MTEIENLPNIPMAEQEEVLKLSVEATEYLNSFKWCTTIKKGYLSKEWGYRLCVFYFEIETIAQTINSVWVIVGDMPPAYIDTKHAASPSQALDRYVILMEDWISHVKTGQSVVECYPVHVEPVEKYADMLIQRTEKIKNFFIPELSNS